MKSFVIFLVIVGIGYSSFAQKPSSSIKVGHASIIYILSQLPESRKIEAELKAYENKLKERIEVKIREYEKLFSEIHSMGDQANAELKNKLKNSESEIQKARNEAQIAYQIKQRDLLEPLQQKIREAIEEVAIENELAYILDKNENILYADGHHDVTEFILEKLILGSN